MSSVNVEQLFAEREIVDAIVSRELPIAKAGVHPSQIRTAISRAASNGLRAGKEKVGNLPLLGEAARAVGMQLEQNNDGRAVEGRLFEEGEHDRFGHLRLPLDLRRQIEGLHMLPDHMPPEFAGWLALNTAVITFEEPDLGLPALWAELRDRSDHEAEGGFPETMRPDEFGVLSGVILTAQCLTNEYRQNPPAELVSNLIGGPQEAI